MSTMIIPRNTMDSRNLILIEGYDRLILDLFLDKPILINILHKLEKLVSRHQIDLEEGLIHTFRILALDRCLLEAFCEIKRNGYSFSLEHDPETIDLILIITLDNSKVLRHTIGGGINAETGLCLLGLPHFREAARYLWRDRMDQLEIIEKKALDYEDTLAAATEAIPTSIPFSGIVEEDEEGGEISSNSTNTNLADDGDHTVTFNEDNQRDADGEPAHLLKSALARVRIEDNQQDYVINELFHYSIDAATIQAGSTASTDFGGASPARSEGTSSFISHDENDFEWSTFINDNRKMTLRKTGSEELVFEMVC